MSLPAANFPRGHVLFRIVSSAIILPLLFGLLFMQPGQAFRLFIVLGVGVAYDEYRRMFIGRDVVIRPWLGCLVLSAGLLPVALGDWLPESLLGLSTLANSSLGLALFFVLAALWRVTRVDIEKGVPIFWAELSGVLYLGVLGTQVLKLHALSLGAWWVLLVMWYAWMYDAGAYFVGRPFGKRKFSPYSPNKTWEGFWGGIAINALLSGLLLPWLFPAGFPLSAMGFAMWSVPASLLAQGGDLFESMLKRYAGVKDSSQMISQHGGFLDKMDSGLFVAPLIYWVALRLGAL